jgi:hypothetical protein
MVSPRSWRHLRAQAGPEDIMLISTRRSALRFGAAALGAGAFGTLAGCASTPDLAAENRQNVGAETYSEDEVINAGADFLGTTAGALGAVVEKVFKEQGRPNAYIKGEEGAGAIGVGLRYGKGVLNTKSGLTQDVYWQGPSIGFDAGGNASKVMTLVYRLPTLDQLYQRFPGVEGTAYFVGGVGVNYQQAGDIVLAPMRVGLGFRAGANIGYLSYTRERSIIPL